MPTRNRGWLHDRSSEQEHLDVHPFSGAINRKKADNFLNCHRIQYEPTLTTNEI